jgi:hypothetical protein
MHLSEPLFSFSLKGVVSAAERSAPDNGIELGDLDNALPVMS